MQYTVEGKLATGARIIYWVTLINGSRGYYEVLGWTSPSRRSEAEGPIQDITQSFREIGTT